MKSEYIPLIIILICFLTAITGIVYIESSEAEKISFSYKKNYSYWKSLNWIGVIFFTICLKIILFPAYVIYLVYKLFTFGRKDL